MINKIYSLEAFDGFRPMRSLCLVSTIEQLIEVVDYWMKRKKYKGKILMCKTLDLTKKMEDCAKWDLAYVPIGYDSQKLMDLIKLMEIDLHYISYSEHFGENLFAERQKTIEALAQKGKV